MAKEKSIQEFYELIFEKYPTIPKKDIKRILQFGFKSFYLHNSYGGDVLVNRKDFWFYCGRLMNDSLKYFTYYKRKIAIKLRVMYKRKQIKWNNTYYFGLNEHQYAEYLNQKNSKGRPRKKFKFSKVFLYKIYDECNIWESHSVALFKIESVLDLGFKVYKEELITDKAELICEKDPLKFEDILLSKYNYEFISDNLRKHRKKTNEK